MYIKNEEINKEEKPSHLVWFLEDGQYFEPGTSGVDEEKAIKVIEIDAYEDTKEFLHQTRRDRDLLTNVVKKLNEEIDVLKLEIEELNFKIKMRG